MTAEGLCAGDGGARIVGCIVSIFTCACQWRVVKLAALGNHDGDSDDGPHPPKLETWWAEKRVSVLFF